MKRMLILALLILLPLIALAACGKDTARPTPAENQTASGDPLLSDQGLKDAMQAVDDLQK